MALHEFQTGSGGGRMSYRPGPEQDRVLGVLGRDLVASTPDPSRTLDWLVYAAVYDLIAAPQEKLRLLLTERDQLAKRAEERDALESELIGTAAQLDAANDQIGQLRTDLDRAEAELYYLHDLLPGENVEKPPRYGRRKRVAGEPNLFFTTNAGLRSCVAGGRHQAHETVGADFDAAVARREELRDEGAIKTPAEAAA